MSEATKKSTIDPQEVEKFAKIANEWWNYGGKFKPLHKFNPIRISYIKEKLIKHFNLDPKTHSNAPLSGLKILDIGCGGGLLCEPLARLGAEVTGIDAAEENIKAAKIHCEKSELNISYFDIDLEEFAEKKEKQEEKFDVVLAMEVVEHIANLDNFIAAASKCLKKDGLMFIATINRTLKSYMMAIVGAEYILRWLPIGTHSWRKFLKPSQINNIAITNDLDLQELNGFEYNLLKDEWKITDNADVNYILTFRKI